MNKDGLATLLLDLLTTEEEKIDNQTRQLSFDIGLLSNRLVFAIDWIINNPGTKNLSIGLFSAVQALLLRWSQLPKEVPLVQ